jgi:hypothetical protein
MYEKELTFEFEVIANYLYPFTVKLEKPWEEMTEVEKIEVIEKNWLSAIQGAEHKSGQSLGHLFCVRDEKTGEEIERYYD